MDAVFPSHNVSESLPKETTASPITLSNRISQEMYRLHRLVPLAKRINEKSYNTTLPFPHRANQTAQKRTKTVQTIFLPQTRIRTLKSTLPKLCSVLMERAKRIQTSQATITVMMTQRRNSQCLECQVT